MSPRLKPLRRGRRPPTKFGSGRGVADAARMGEETQQEITGAWTSLKKDYNMIVIPAYLYEADAHYLCLHGTFWRADPAATASERRREGSKRLRQAFEASI